MLPPFPNKGQFPLFQKICDLGNNAVPDLRDGVLIKAHENCAHHDYDEHDDEPAGHLVAAWICQHICGFDSRRIDFVFYNFEHNKYLRFLVLGKEKGEALASLRCALGILLSQKARDFVHDAVPNRSN